MPAKQLDQFPMDFNGDSFNKSGDADEEQVIEIEALVTPSQHKAIIHPVEPEKCLQLVSGPGAGKTLTLVYKVIHMLGTLEMDPSDILVLSMTNRAVDNFKNSILRLTNDKELVEKLNIHTFHGFGHKLLIDSDESYKNREILEDSGWALLNKLMDNTKLSKYKLQSISKDLKNKMEIDELCLKHSIAKDVALQLTQFFDELKVLTHTDIISITREMIQSNRIELAHKVTIVDEFQDMYDETIELITLVSKHSHLIIAGDPNQSIYGFLGSNEKAREKLLSLKPIVETIELDRSFRASPQLLDASKYVLDNNYLKTSENDTFNEDGYKPVVQFWEDSLQQNESCALEILRLVEESNGVIKPKDIAILSRTNAELQQFNKALGFYGLSGYKLSSQPAWLSDELFHLIEYLRILVHPNDSDFAVLSTMALLPGIGPVAVKKAYQTFLLGEGSVLEALREQPKCREYVSLINQTIADMDYNDPMSILDGLLNLGTRLGVMEKSSKKVKEMSDLLRYRNQIYEFFENLKISQQLQKSKNNEEVKNQSLAEFFLNNYMNLLPYSSTANKSVKLSTIHSAKGLEFPIVFMLDSKQSDLRTLEEKRLYYVGMTRAKSLLYLNFIKNNQQFTNPYWMINSEKKFEIFKNEKFFQFEKPKITPDFLNRGFRRNDGALAILGNRSFHTLRRLKIKI